jgi:hypothetical protein
MLASLAGAFDPSYPSDAPMFVVLVLGAKDWGTWLPTSNVYHWFVPSWR